MNAITRRSAICGSIVSTAAIGANALATDASEAPDKTFWTLEGELKVHPKFVYRYYLELLDGQKCALYGQGHHRETDQLRGIAIPNRVRVRGTLGTESHTGGTPNNPSPFPAGWWVYMDVHEVKVLK